MLSLREQFWAFVERPLTQTGLGTVFAIVGTIVPSKIAMVIAGMVFVIAAYREGWLDSPKWYKCVLRVVAAVVVVTVILSIIWIGAWRFHERPALMGRREPSPVVLPSRPTDTSSVRLPDKSTPDKHEGEKTRKTPKQPNSSQQQSDGHDNAQAGPVTTGACSNVQIGGSGNQATTNCEVDRRIVQSLVLRAFVETDTTPLAVSGPETDVGLQSFVALFTADKTRIRFASDWKITTQQVNPTRERVSFVYTPETPSELMGRDVTYLSQMTTFVVNYAEIFKTLNFKTDNANTIFHCEILLNGIPVGVINADVKPAGQLDVGQSNMAVAEVFSRIPAIYEAAVTKR